MNNILLFLKNSIQKVSRKYNYWDGVVNVFRSLTRSSISLSHTSFLKAVGH